jgi:hypothetical protein
MPRAEERKKGEVSRVNFIGKLLFRNSEQSKQREMEFREYAHSV